MFKRLTVTVFAVAGWVALLPGLAGVAQAATPSPPFTQCPPAGADTSCRILLVINADGTVTAATDTAVAPTYDGADDTLIGVQNNSTRTIPMLHLTSTTGPGQSPAFAFDFDGLCSFNSCSFGPTGYEGPNTSFSNIAPDAQSGDVNFTGGLAPGASAYFSLEGAIDAQGLHFTANPTLTTKASASVPLGGKITDTATLTGGAAPTGTLTFNLYGPGDTSCGTSIATTTAAVNGNGSYTSTAFTTTKTGTYRWIAAYGGDANNNPAGPGDCNDPAESVTVTPQRMTGRAYGIALNGVVTVSPIPDTGPVSTTSAGTTSTPCVATVTGSLTAHTLCANVTTALNPGKSTSTASVADAALGLFLVPSVQMRAVQSTSQTTCAGSTGQATIGFLKVGNTLVAANAQPAPNTTSYVLGVKVILNEQTPVPGGLTVNAAHIIIPGAADLIVASATSDIHNCP